MHILKKAAVSIAAASMILSPMAASAASMVDGARATTAADGTNKLSGSSWLPALLALAVIAGGIWLIADNDDDAPVSP